MSNRSNLARHTSMSTETAPQTPRIDLKSRSEQPHLRAILLLACLAQFMVILDVSVVNVALPSIRNSLRFSEQDLQWVVNAYTVTFAGFLLLGGRAADLLGRRRVFISGLVAVLARIAGRRLRRQPAAADRRPRGAGTRRRDHRARVPVDPDHHVRGGPGPQPRRRHLGRDGWRRRRRRRAPGRRAHRSSELALDPVHQRARSACWRRCSPQRYIVESAPCGEAETSTWPARSSATLGLSRARARDRPHRRHRLGVGQHAGADRRRRRPLIVLFVVIEGQIAQRCR